MDIVLLISAYTCLLGGLLGAFLPLPGPPLSFLGIWLIHFTDKFQFTDELLYTLGTLTLVLTVLDYYIPIWGAKKFGGSKYGSWGSGIGMLTGLFLGPLGLFIGAFAGAFLGEFLYQKDSTKSMKAAVGSFLGLVSGIILKTTLCIYMLYVGIKVWM
jgi:uncharacterized protein